MTTTTGDPISYPVSFGPSYRLTRFVFLRLLGVIYFIAFLSLGLQVRGLFGARGISPAAPFLDIVYRNLGMSAYWKCPTLLWLNSSDAMLTGLCIAGVGISLLLIAGVAQMACLVMLWAMYLSFLSAGAPFLSFQWDTLLLETGFLAIFFAPVQFWPRLSRWTEPPRIVLWLLRGLLFKLMILSGLTKLTAGDQAWWDLTALSYHYWTQPLPTALAWYADKLPDWFQRFSCAAMFFIELAVPFAIFAPRFARLAAFFILTGIQLLIAATGNYCFFNLLTIALCIPLLDDRFLLACTPKTFSQWFWQISSTNATASQRTFSPWFGRTAINILVAIIWTTQSLFASIIEPFPGSNSWLTRASYFMVSYTYPLHSINGYGLFRSMTKQRHEIIIQGSSDGITWQNYELPWQPSNPARKPGLNAPFQPRLDWQMWFAALTDPSSIPPRFYPPWILDLALRLTEGSPDALALFSKNPFPDAPPRFIRMTIHDFHFSSRADRDVTGQWWEEKYLGEYLPPVDAMKLRAVLGRP